jgi:hypothetical protein
VTALDIGLKSLPMFGFPEYGAPARARSSSVRLVLQHALHAFRDAVEAPHPDHQTGAVERRPDIDLVARSITFPQT